MSKPSKEPKVEYYGKAEERINLNIQVALNDQVQELKIKVYNTSCALDAQALGIPLKPTFPHLSGLTCAEYFCTNILAKDVYYLEKNIDIKKLNDYHRKLAIDGKNASKKDKVNSTCISCEKDSKTGETVKCHMCKKYSHKSCALKTISTASLERVVAKNEFVCEKCYSQPEYNDDFDDVPNLLKKLCILNDEKVIDENDSEQTVEKCTLCDFSSIDGELL